MLIVVEALDEKLFLAARNLPHVEVRRGARRQSGRARRRYDKVLLTVGGGEDDRGAPAMNNASSIMSDDSVLLAPHVTEKTSLADAEPQPVHVPRAPRRDQGRRQGARSS